jgi:hypothetical protein
MKVGDTLRAACFPLRLAERACNSNEDLATIKKGLFGPSGQSGPKTAFAKTFCSFLATTDVNAIRHTMGNLLEKLGRKRWCTFFGV